MQPDSANIARHLPLMATRQPGHPAVKIPRGRTPAGAIDYLTLTFAELDAEVDAWVARLAGRGVRPGDRVLVMVRQGLPLIAAVFALFKLGAVPVIIDPGMGRKNFLACVAHTRPRVLLGIQFAQILSRIFWSPFRSIEVRVGASRDPLARLTNGSLKNFPTTPRLAEPTADTLAAILFTSGSTGAPKGVCYEHGMFDAQVRLIRDTYRIEPGEIDLSLLPVFALFSPALGMTTIVPEIDPSRPVAVPAEKLIQAILQEKVTNSFGSPALWRKIFTHCTRNGIQLPSLRRVLCAGAPVPLPFYREAHRILPAGVLHSPYGATEALPVSTISADEVLGAAAAARSTASSHGAGTAPVTAAGYGTCVGRPIAGIDVRIIAIAEGSIASIAEVRELAGGEIGEIIVRGPVVTKRYDNLPEATAASKIPDLTPHASRLKPDGGAAAVWHRMGDCGRIDAEGRLWFCGRVAERVVTAAGTLFTDPCEQVFRTLIPQYRCALIGLGPQGRQRPALVVEANLATTADRIRLFRQYRAAAATQPQTAGIALFFFHKRFPVDVRHNAKIHRLALARWAATARGYGGQSKR
ncbi:MAG: fatty acid CoA ligase family protein [Opitutaceae bacterium]|nr:fatty acid CoA ligase family protein [Opitutaceae bacterium]